MDEEASKLAEYKMKHGPTIGSMYEGLSADIVDKVVPENLGLQVVNGFVVDAQGNMSGQIDCMLVKGSGERVPHTNSYKWPIRDVLAVFEIKKNLSYADLKDSFVHLRDVYDSFRAWHDSQQGDIVVDVQMALKAFGQITGVHTNGRTDDVPENLQLLHYTLCIEQLSPVRIVWAYGGYKTQKGLRTALLNFLEQTLKDNDVGAGFGVPCFPHLISCNGVSLVKGNGQPYRAQMDRDYWPFLFSSVTNPLWLMLELIWTKISNTYKVQIPFDDGLVQEAFAPFLSARSMAHEGRTGWYYKISDPQGLDDAPRDTIDWKPVEITEAQFVIFQELGRDGRVDTTDEGFMRWIASKEQTLEEFVRAMQATGLAAYDGKYLHPTTDIIHTVITPDGKYLAGNNSEQMIAYVLGPQSDAKAT